MANPHTDALDFFSVADAACGLVSVTHEIETRFGTHNFANALRQTDSDVPDVTGLAIEQLRRGLHDTERQSPASTVLLLKRALEVAPVLQAVIAANHEVMPDGALRALARYEAAVGAGRPAVAPSSAPRR